MEYIWAAILAGKVLAGGIAPVDNPAHCALMHEANRTFYQQIDRRIRIRHDCRDVPNICVPGTACPCEPGTVCRQAD